MVDDSSLVVTRSKTPSVFTEQDMGCREIEVEWIGFGILKKVGGAQGDSKLQTKLLFAYVHTREQNRGMKNIMYK